MPKRRPVDLIGLTSLFERDDNVATRAELQELGLASATITYRSRPGGPWQRPLPGVVVAQTGPLTQRQRMLCALKYAGRGAVLTGPAVLRVLGFRSAPSTTDVHVLVPAGRHRASCEFVVVERSHVATDIQVVDAMPFAGTARAVVDACRRNRAVNGVRAMISEAVQRHTVSIAALAAEIKAGAARGSAMPRRVMREVRAGIRSVAEAQARKIIAGSRLPQPAWNRTLTDRRGSVLAVADAYWEAFGVVLEIDSVEWHLSPSDYRRTQRRHALLGRHGIRVIPYAPSDVSADPGLLLRTIADTLAASSGPAEDVRALATPAPDAA